MLAVDKLTLYKFLYCTNFYLVQIKNTSCPVRFQGWQHSISDICLSIWGSSFWASLHAILGEKSAKFFFNSLAPGIYGCNECNLTLIILSLISMTDIFPVKLPSCECHKKLLLAWLPKLSRVIHVLFEYVFAYGMDYVKLAQAKKFTWALLFCCHTLQTVLGHFY